VRWAAALSCILLLAFTSSCTRRPSTRQIALASDDPRPGSFVASLQARNEKHQSLSAALRVSLDAPDLRLRRPQRLALIRPTQLRVEILGLFGQVAAVLVSDGETYQFFDAGEGRVQSGPVSEHIFWELARVDLTPGEVVELLMGAPVPDRAWLRSGAFALLDDALAVEYADAGGVRRQRFEFDAAGRLRSARSYDEIGREIWRAGYDDYRDLQGSEFPFFVLLESVRVDATAKFVFQNVQLDPALSNELFQLESPGTVSAD